MKDSNKEKVRFVGDFEGQGLTYSAEFKGRGDIDSYYFHGELGFPLVTLENRVMDGRIRKLIEDGLPAFLWGRRDLVIEVGMSIKITRSDLDEDLGPAPV